jgi:hypothetical protein
MAQIITIQGQTSTVTVAFDILKQVTAVPIMTIEAWRVRPNETGHKAKLIDIFIKNNPDGIVLVLT